MQPFGALHKATLFAVLILLLVFAGCIPSAVFTETGPGTAASEYESKNGFIDYVYNQETAYYSTGAYAAAAEKGYYLLINSVLHFYDIQTDSVFPLCTKESCMHRDESCQAYMFDWSTDPAGQTGEWTSNCTKKQIYYHNGFLFMVGWHRDRGYALFRYAADYTGQTEIVWLTDFEEDPINLCMIESILFCNGYLYYLSFPYGEGNVQKPSYNTVFTAWRVRLEEKAKPEKLFSFDGTYSWDTAARILSYDDCIYFIVRTETGRWESENLVMEKAYKYDEKEREEFIWSYEGQETVNLLGAEEAEPEDLSSMEYLMNPNGDYVYLTGGKEESSGRPTSISSVSLVSGKGKILYRTPYKWIEQLRTDGTNYYFLEIGMGENYLTSIDSEGGLLRRYEIAYTEEYLEELKTSGRPREQWTAGSLRLLVADGRYLVIGAYDLNVYQDLTSDAPWNTLDPPTVDQGIGLIRTEDFIGGKDIEIRQIYERGE